MVDLFQDVPRIAGWGPLVGRGRELAAIAERVSGAAEGQGAVVLVAGEPGCGKTRLLEEAAARAQARGFVVLRGGASDAEGMPPYLPFLEALGRLIRSMPPATLRLRTGATAATLAGILPEVVQRLGELPAAYPLPPEQARLRLYEAVGTFLAASAADTPLLLLLDDLHWADRATLDLLCYAARHEPGARLVILGAYRDAELADNAALLGAIAELNRRRLLMPLAVERLSPPETAELAAGYLGQSVDAGVSSLLHGESEGNAFYAEELLRDWIERGVIGRSRDRWRLLARPENALPASIAGTIRERLARLAPEIVEHLRIAAIIGRTFDIALLAEVAGSDIEAVELRLSAATRARLVHAGRSGVMSFAHDKIRECLYEEVIPSRRTRLHRAIGEALERRGPDPSPRQLADLAFHFARSGEREQGVRYSERAAAAAMDAYAAGEAARHLRAALDLLDTDDRRRAALLLRLGEATLLAGAEQEAAVAYQAAEIAARAVGNREAAGRAAHGQGRAWARLEEHTAAHMALTSALSLVQDAESAEAVDVLVDLANLLAVSLGRETEGIASSRRALELAHALGDRRLEATAMRTAGNLLARTGSLAEGARLLEQALAIAAEIDDPLEAAECCACLVPLYLWMADIRRGLEISRTRVAFARRCNDPYQLRHAEAAMAVLNAAQGHFGEAEAAIRQGQALTERLASDEPLAFLRFAEGSLAYRRGDYAAAERSLDAAMQTFRAMGPAALVWYIGLVAVVQLAAGKRSEALATMAEVDAAIAANPPGSIATAHALVCQGAIVATLGDRGLAEQYYAQLTPFRGTYSLFLVDRILGMLAMLLGDLAAARPLLDAAEARARQEGMRPELVRTFVARAELALSEGGKGSAVSARDLLRQALEIATDTGMAGDVTQIRARLRSLPTQPGTRVRPHLPAGLTEREAAVLRLLAAGRSNREIGSALALSEKTVANHITGIFTKTGAENRAAAAAFAIRHGLA